MKATDTIRIRIEPSLKQKLQSLCDERGVTLSQVIRDFLIKEANHPLSVAERYESIMANARTKIEATGLEEPDIDDINSYIEAVRKERLSDMGLGKSA